MLVQGIGGSNVCLSRLLGISAVVFLSGSGAGPSEARMEQSVFMLSPEAERGATPGPALGKKNSGFYDFRGERDRGTGSRRAEKLCL